MTKKQLKEKYTEWNKGIMKAGERQTEILLLTTRTVREKRRRETLVQY